MGVIRIIAAIIDNLLDRILNSDQSASPYRHRQWYPADAKKSLRLRLGFPVKAAPLLLEPGETLPPAYGDDPNAVKALRLLTKRQDEGWTRWRTALCSRADHRETLRTAIYHLVEDLSALPWTDTHFQRIEKCEMCGTGGTRTSRTYGLDVTFTSITTASYHTTKGGEGLRCRSTVPRGKATLALCTQCHKDLGRAAAMYTVAHWLSSPFTVVIQNRDEGHDLATFVGLSNSNNVDGVSAFPHSLTIRGGEILVKYVADSDTYTILNAGQLKSVNRVDLETLVKMVRSRNPCNADIDTTIVAGTIPASNSSSTCLKTAIAFMLDGFIAGPHPDFVGGRNHDVMKHETALRLATAIISNEPTWQRAIQATAALLCLEIVVQHEGNDDADDQCDAVFNVDKYLTGPCTTHIVTTDCTSGNHSDMPDERPEGTLTHHIVCAFPRETAHVSITRISYLKAIFHEPLALYVSAHNLEHSRTNRIPVTIRKVSDSDVQISLWHL